MERKIYISTLFYPQGFFVLWFKVLAYILGKVILQFLDVFFFQNKTKIEVFIYLVAYGFVKVGF